MKKTLFILFSALLLSSCTASMMTMLDASQNMTRVELGMTKHEVIQIMSERYESVSNRITPEGEREEAIGYYNDKGNVYILTFKNDILVEYHQKWLNHHDHDNGHTRDRK